MAAYPAACWTARQLKAVQGSLSPLSIQPQAMAVAAAEATVTAAVEAMLLHKCNALPLQEEFAKERAQVDAVVANIEEEDRQEAAARKAQQLATRDYVQSFVEEQQRLKQRRQQELDAEDARQAGLPEGMHPCRHSQHHIANTGHAVQRFASFCRLLWQHDPQHPH